jgi:hypothetical protein
MANSLWIALGECFNVKEKNDLVAKLFHRSKYMKIKRANLSVSPFLIKISFDY